MKTTLLAMTSLVVALSAVCMGGGPVDVSEAEGRWASGDLPGASASWASLQGENPDATEVLIGAAYDHLLAGNWDAADAALAHAQEASGDEDGSLQLRRAIVALQAGRASGEGDRVDAIKTHGIGSGQPMGKLLAAEGHLVDSEVDEALTLLKEVRSTPGQVGQTAESYLALLESGSIYKVGLAEANALWAVGLRPVACEAAAEAVRALPDDDPSKSDQLLLWASRSVTAGMAGEASVLLDEVSLIGSPQGQEWRVQATRAMVFVADGQVDEAVGVFDALQTAAEDGFVPYEGLQDARATAAGLASSPAEARSLVGDVESVAAARGLYRAGASRVARDAAPGNSALATFLENR